MTRRMNPPSMSDQNQKLLDHKSTSVVHTNVALPNHQGNPKTGTKRLFSNRSSTTQCVTHRDSKIQDENGLLSLSFGNGRQVAQVSGAKYPRGNPEPEDDLETHSEKRHRTSDWPLKSNNGSSERPTPIRPVLQDRYNVPNFPSNHQRASSQPRPSKFIEGSMNDRTSQKPQQLYIGGSDGTQEKFEPGICSHGKDIRKPLAGHLPLYAGQPAADSVCDKLEASRPSSIFRFGKSLVAAFNPSTWKIWSKSHEEGDTQGQILKERRERAEKIYSELRRNGQSPSTIYAPNAEVRGNRAVGSKYDLGVEFSRSASMDGIHSVVVSEFTQVPLEEKRYGQIFLDPPIAADPEQKEDIASETSSSPKKSSFHVRKPSLPNIYMNYGNKYQTAPTDDLSNGSRILRRLPSRKDLQNQQKLVKRVSDLEGKLEAARRQLAQALGEPVPAHAQSVDRLRFTQGALASLPSESLLSAYVVSDSETDSRDAFIGIGKALSTNDCTSTQVTSHSAAPSEIIVDATMPMMKSNQLSSELPFPASKASGEDHDAHQLKAQTVQRSKKAQAVRGPLKIVLANSDPKLRLSRKRKSIGIESSKDDNTYKPSEESADGNSSEPVETPVPKRKPGRQRKAPKMDFEPIPQTLKSGLRRAKPSSPARVHDRDLTPLRMEQLPENGHSILTKQPPTSITRSRIPKKGHEIVSKNLQSSISAGTDASKEVSTEKKAVQNADSLVPPVPQLPRSVRLSSGDFIKLPATDINVMSQAGITSHGGIVRDHKSSNELSKEGGKVEVKTKHSFEWPADVF